MVAINKFFFRGWSLPKRTGSASNNFMSLCLGGETSYPFSKSVESEKSVDRATQPGDGGLESGVVGQTGEFGDVISTRDAVADTSSLQLYDASGNVSQTTDASSSITATLAYDTFGVVTDNSGPADPTVAWQGKQGYQFEQPLGLQYVRQRWYDPATRQFISPDPLGFPDATVPWGIESGQVSGGDTNLYRYAGNNPVNANDPGGQNTINDLPLPAVPLTPPLHKTTSKPMPLPTLAHPQLHPALAGIKRQLADPSITPLPQSLSHALLYKPSLPALPSDPLARQIYAAELAYQQSHTAAPGQMITLGASPHAIGAPGFWTSLIPIYGSGRAAINDYQTGHWGWGLFNTALAASDVLLVGDLYKIGAKLVVKGGAEILEKEGGQEVLAHLTSREAELAIKKSGLIYGRWGIFALPKEHVPDSIFLRRAWTWVPGDLGGPVEIPGGRKFSSAHASSLQLYDASGNVNRTTDAGANITATLSYDAFGSVTDNSGPQNPTVAWQGKQG